jgi:hypothetical protein
MQQGTSCLGQRKWARMFLDPEKAIYDARLREQQDMGKYNPEKAIYDARLREQQDMGKYNPEKAIYDARMREQQDMGTLSFKIIFCYY